MIVLNAIGGFFKKIWTWIKDTAWVQPLLIVGLIFGVIFSIPSIVKGITKLKEDLNSSEAYYTRFQKTLVGGKNSEADKITDAIEAAMDGENTLSAYGEKFFLCFVSNECANCTEAKEGFEVLSDGWGKKYSPDAGMGNEFKMYTIFTDEVTHETTSSKTAFVQYLDRHIYFFEQVAAEAYQFDYYKNGHLSDADLIAMAECSTDFLTPTILLVDTTEKSANLQKPVVSEVMFGVTGDKSSNKADLLLDCWNHTGEFIIE